MRTLLAILTALIVGCGTSITTSIEDREVTVPEVTLSGIDNTEGTIILPGIGNGECECDTVAIVQKHGHGVVTGSKDGIDYRIAFQAKSIELARVKGQIGEKDKVIRQLSYQVETEIKARERTVTFRDTTATIGKPEKHSWLDLIGMRLEGLGLGVFLVLLLLIVLQINKKIPKILPFVPGRDS